MPETDDASGAIAGVDGIPNGWIAAVQSPDGRTHLEVLSSFESLVSRRFDRVLIDIPIGLPDAPHRECDREARRLIGPRRSSVFPTPIRAMLDAPDYSTACEARFAADGNRCSKQLFALLPKIREVDAGLTPELQSRVREGHPEVSFTMMNGGSPMQHHKANGDGRSERYHLLRSSFRDLEESLESLGHAGWFCDALDAYALLWSAGRLRAGVARILPETLETDSCGLRAEMIA